MAGIQSETDRSYEKDAQITMRNNVSGENPALKSSSSGIPSKNHPPGGALEKASEKGFYEEFKRQLNFKQRRKRRAAQRQWKRLRKLNNRFKKKVCKMQNLRNNITQLQARIVEAKQDIVDHNRHRKDR